MDKYKRMNMNIDIDREWVLDLHDYMKNPIILLNHHFMDKPIGRLISIKEDKAKIEVFENMWEIVKGFKNLYPAGIAKSIDTETGIIEVKVKEMSICPVGESLQIIYKRKSS